MNQRFTAYIMIPMFPEGDPASMPIQEILYWQTRTIEMMYKRIGDALQETGNPTHPTDWLIFLCPGMYFEVSNKQTYSFIKMNMFAHFTPC